MQTNAETMDDKDEEDDFDLMNLTDEEREALRESDDEGDNTDEQEIPDQSAKEGEEEQEQQGQEGDPGDEGAEVEPEEAEGVVADEPEPEPVAVEPTTDERMAGIAAARKELADLYDDGELDTSEYMDKREALQRQELQIDFEQREAKIHSDIQQAEQDKQWKKANDEFFTANSDYNTTRGLRTVLQEHYNDVHNDPKFAQASFQSRLNEAKRRSDAELGRGGVTAQDPATDTDAAKRAAMKGRGQEAGKVQPGLSDIPAAAGATPESGGKYAHIDALEGTAHEVALSKLSESELDAWVASQD